MQKLIGLTLMLIGASAGCFAGVVAVPEIDASSGAAAVTLIAGSLVVLRGRRKKK